ncbi:SIS domain-containing protein [Devosia sp. ZB163]|uniref:SIS domain-containing protein n=1 Tax=Devosia sp. ZB163 TaxID=3025938 RepID=UPI0023628616|nr:SIS domain-containing protein [Devosia sp. ZB163]MDC9824123.1 SIS domain-containing protein [Devosia sp. ZB163]
MRLEVEETPSAIARLLSEGRADFARAGAALRERDPAAIVTIARGSSDHASSFLKYAIELLAGVPVASVGPSIVSIYGRELKLGRTAAIATSQSGKSPDIVAMTEAAHRSGALTIALTNTPNSPLAVAADQTIALRSGEEKSVAATKTFVASVVAGLGIVGNWLEDKALLAALESLPQVLEEAVHCDWSPLLGALDNHQSLYVLGRGPSLAIASEAALKFKETCSIHAEAYSSAEVIHGPARIVEHHFPVLALAARDAAENSIIEVSERLAGQGARVFITSANAKSGERLPFAASGHPITDALALIVSFYGLVEALSRRRGFDPDRPPHLKKVTETI